MSKPTSKKRARAPCVGRFFRDVLAGFGTLNRSIARRLRNRGRGQRVKRGRVDGEAGMRTGFVFERLGCLHVFLCRVFCPPELTLEPRQPFAMANRLFRGNELATNFEDASPRRVDVAANVLGTVAA